MAEAAKPAPEAAADDDDEDADDADAAAEASTATAAGTAASLWARTKVELAKPWVQLFLGVVLPALVLVLQMEAVWSFTIDDAYISFRYARNLSRGLGLVYNAGERIEGYTNFLFTVLLAGGIKVGVDPVLLSKLVGAACALGSLYLTFLLSRRFRPQGLMPVVSTWLLASTIVFAGYAIFGLETSFFLFFVLLGLFYFFRETSDQNGEGFPWSGVAFAVAGLTRPEAPLFLGIPMLLLGPRRFFAKQNLVRGALFAAVVAAHMIFRKSYYGTWLPNTLSAKTGDLSVQIDRGLQYLKDYATHAGAAIWLALYGAAIGVDKKHREVLTVAVLAAACLGYVTLVGGDWMPYFRFMSPIEPFVFLLVDLGVRTIVEAGPRAGRIALAAFALVAGYARANTLRDARTGVLREHDKFWRQAAGGTADWLVQHGVPGEIAIGDIGYVGWKTDYPVLDTLGLVDPVISKLPGGYTQKLGPGFTDRIFDKAPRYALVISSNIDCRQPSVPGSQVLVRDPRFYRQYEVSGKVRLDRGFAWCIYERRDLKAQSAGSKP